MRPAPLLLCVLFACHGTPPSPARSAVTCGPCEARADDFETVRVRVRLRDEKGRPVAGVRVLIGGLDSAVSDDEGDASAAVRSLRPGKRRLDARLPDGTPLGSVAVTFFAGSFPRVDVSER